jgi:hypothetical protein
MITRRHITIKETDIIIERDGPFVCITWDYGRLKLTPREARNIAADLDRTAVEMAQEVLK